MRLYTLRFKLCLLGKIVKASCLAQGKHALQMIQAPSKNHSSEKSRGLETQMDKYHNSMVFCPFSHSYLVITLFLLSTFPLTSNEKKFYGSPPTTLLISFVFLSSAPEMQVLVIQFSFHFHLCSTTISLLENLFNPLSLANTSMKMVSKSEMQVISLLNFHLFVQLSVPFALPFSLLHKTSYSS